MGNELKIIPLGNRVIIKVVEGEEVTKGGIYLPSAIQEAPQTGTVLAVGLGRCFENGNREQMEIKVGDKILFVKHAGTDIKYDGIDYKILTLQEIIGIIEE